MLTDSRKWTLQFDGRRFRLEPGASSPPGARYRVIEESLETILFLWGNQLLVAPKLQMLGYSGAVTREQDLLAVDELGRIHIFELKKDTADEEAMFQLVSYVTGRPRDDEHWVRETVAHTLWYGDQAIACRLAGLVARTWTKTLRTSKSRRVAGEPVPEGERLQAKLEVLTELSNKRVGLGLSPDAYQDIARSLLRRGFGRAWHGPLEAPGGVLDEVAKSKMPPQWQLGRTDPGIVIWMVAPNIDRALRAAQPLMQRGLEIRCVSLDVREVVPGREWRVAVAEPARHVQNWAVADAFAQLLVEAASKHTDEYPGAGSRLRLRLRPASMPWAAEKGRGDLGWKAAGEASIEFSVLGDRIRWELYNHWWTDGQALKIRGPLLQLCKDLRREHPRTWAWSPHDPGAESNQRFVEGAAAVANAFYQGLLRIGAFDVDPWAYWMPGDPPDHRP